MIKKKYKLVGVSGTFQPPLHAGHVTLIKKAFEVSEKVMIGVTSDEMTKHKTLSEKIPSFDERKQNILLFLKKNRFIERAIVIKLSDPFGPSIEDKGLEAIIVSEETLFMGKVINQKRKEKNLPPIDFIGIKMVLAEDGGPISSTRMRQEIIDKLGRIKK
ncbi:MAG: phosphopantetheine adenylyltransferase [Candidatus Helarchaeota archaeon]